MNLYLYTLTAKSLKRTATRLRIFVGSGVAAILFVLFLLIPGIPTIIRRFLGPIAVSMAATAVIFRLKKVSDICRTTGYLFVYAFLLGGMMKFLFSTAPFFRERQESIWYILGVGMIGCQIGSWWIEQMKKRKKTDICRVQLCSCDNAIEVDALLDTGNSLREPISGKPVSVVEEAVMDKLTGVRVPEKLRMIPYHSVGKSNGVMEGYEIPELIIKGEEEIHCKKVMIGISKNKISANGRYQMILHPDLNKEGK